MKKNKIYTTQYSDVHDYNTIHKQNLYIQFCNTELSKRGVINMGGGGGKPWAESASELYRPSNRRLSAK
jgi:hypothetical protein